MSVEPIESVLSGILERYNKHPEGWSVLSDGKGNMLILGPTSGYRLKLIHLNPQEYTGVGIKIEDIGTVQDIVGGVPSYGFRPLAAEDATALLHNVQSGEIQNRLITKLLGMKPVPTWKLEQQRTQAVLSGPVVTHPNLNAISQTQRELEAMLTKEANKLFMRRYRERAAIYG